MTAADYAHVVKTKWTLKHQEITLAVDPNKQELDAHIVATIRANEKDIDKLVIQTDKIEDAVVRYQGGPKLKSTFKVFQGSYGRLVVELPHALTPDADTKLEITYKAKLQCDAGGYMLKPCSFGKNFWSVAFFRYYLGNFGAARHPFTSNLYIVTPADRVAAAPGIPHPAVKEIDGRLKWRFEQPERTQNAGFSIAKYTVTGPQVGEDVQGGPAVRVYTLPSFAPNAKNVLGVAESVIDFAGKAFGAFPWAGVNLIQMANNFGGGYAPLSGIFMSGYVFGAKYMAQGWKGLVELAAHEMAHQWWGNYVRPATSNDTSLSESLAEFTSCYYTEKTLKSRSQIIGDNLSYVYTVQSKYDRPLGSVYAHSSPAYVQIMYHKGAVVMDMLRLELGDEGWFKVLADFVKAYGRDYARWQDLRDTVQKSTGKDLDWYFKQWFAGLGYVRAEITGRVVKADAGYKLRLRIAHLGSKPMRFRLPLRVYFPGGAHEDTHVDILPVEGTHLSVAELTFDKRPVGVRPDRTRRVLRRLQLLTPGDVNLDGLADGRDFVEMAFRARRAIVFTVHGKERYMPNASWDELYDVVPNNRIDDEDLDHVANAIGTEGIDF